MDYKQHQTSLSSYTMTKIPSDSITKVIRSGPVSIRERSAFSGTRWKARRLELDGQVLTIINLVSNKRSRIELRDITELERTDLTEHSLCLKAREKFYNFSFASDPELYDWQDDIYQRCPLGNYSTPFDFVHKSHIGSDNVAGTFTDPNILPIYAEIVSGQPVVSKTSAGVVVTPRSRPTSGLHLNAKPIKKASSLPSTPNAPLLEGLYVLKQTRFFAGWLWRERWLSLTPQSLVIHRRKTKKSSASKSIPLFSLSRIEPDERREGCLIVEYSSIRQTPPSSAPASNNAVSPKDTLSILFKSYDELYTWRDALYDRSPLSLPIGYPTGFMHSIHVGIDPDSGAFTGLPTEWQTVNPSSSKAGATGNKHRRQSKRKSDPANLEPPLATA